MKRKWMEENRNEIEENDNQKKKKRHWHTHHYYAVFVVWVCVCRVHCWRKWRARRGWVCAAYKKKTECIESQPSGRPAIIYIPCVKQRPSLNRTFKLCTALSSSLQIPLVDIEIRCVSRSLIPVWNRSCHLNWQKWDFLIRQSFYGIPDNLNNRTY